VAFNTPNLGPLGEVGVDFQINWHRIQRHNFEGRLNVFTDMNQDISVLNFSPFLNLKVIESILMNSKAVVI
jgi:L-asparaginase/Glu-tRNA(Gln) amidotransferase subunit D